MNYKIKIVVGFRPDQIISISLEEAHKGYHLFNHPNERGTFENGFAIRGVDIQRIEPDYNGTMGWNPDHVLDSYDWVEIRKLGVDRKLRELMQQASDISKSQNPSFHLPLSEVLKLRSDVKLLIS